MAIGTRERLPIPALLLRKPQQEQTFEEDTYGSSWGWFPALSIFGALAVLLVAIAHAGARYNAIWAQPLYWTGLVALVGSCSFRLAMPDIARREVLGLLIFLGISLYLVKILQSPLRFSFFDEFLHWRTANDIIKHERLFTENSLLPVSPLYPGLEIVTVAISKLTGLSIFVSGVIVVGLARLLLVLTIYLFYEYVSSSVQVAALGSVIYMGNPHFLIFDAQFAYESLALPIGMLVLLAILRKQVTDGIERTAFSLVAAALLSVLIGTHHATSYMMTIFLVTWAIITVLYNARASLHDELQPGVTRYASFAVILNVIWLLTVSRITIGYLGPHITEAFHAIVELIKGEGSDRELFKSSTGVKAPILEQLTGLAGPGLIMLLLLPGIWFAWKRHRRNATAAWLAILALSYPVTLVMRLTGGGWEISARSSVFVFFPLAFVLALALHYTRLPWKLEAARQPLVALYLVAVFCSGIIAGWSPWARMPWPYMVGADTRSVEPQGLAAAEWTAHNLGPDNRMAADRVNMTLLGTYGEQRMITDLIDKVSISGIFLATRIGPNELDAIQRGRIRYILVDRRISTALPLDGHYYESWEKMIAPYTDPVSTRILEKYDHRLGVNRIFDSGDIIIYDVEVLRDE